ncbi:MAG: hypothetical protein ACKO3W_12600, partial [bacterium]
VDGTETAIEDSGRGVLFELPWRGAAGTQGVIAPPRLFEGPSLLPMSLFATHAAFVELSPGGALFTIHGHLYVEEESHAPSPGVAFHRVR